MEALEETGERWVPTRAAALERLAAFVPRAGRAYAAQRNYDRSPAARQNVSTLSPYIRHRALAETEVLAAVLAEHSQRDAFKFVQEVFWRTYWKGWLEAHPAVWAAYLEALETRLATLERTPEPAAAYGAAIAGRTGIDAFDAWANELVRFNYLHNHARMWFASIWIFTLRLPWELGADFFMRHLLDGDQASNTLSWRWVAGLHTRGKTYRATRDNIRRYTENRFDPGEALATTTPALRESTPAAAALLVRNARAYSGEPALLVLHDDDLGVATLDVPNASIAAVCALRATAARSPQPVAASVHAFGDALADDALALAARRFNARNCGRVDARDQARAAALIGDHLRANGVEHIVTPFAPVGPVRDAFARLEPSVGGTVASIHDIERRYDRCAWPHATRGFYGLGTRVPEIIRELGLSKPGPGADPSSSPYPSPAARIA